MNLSRFLQSFRFAYRGLRHAVLNEQNFKIKILAGILVLALMYIFELIFIERVILITFIFLVLSFELLNTAIEHFTDLVESKFNKKVKVVKDLMAAVVLTISIGAAIVGIMIFYPYIIEQLS
ncbi:MAG: diacylglycerol kinase [Candidatus Paceibacteria bacterium]